MFNIVIFSEGLGAKIFRLSLFLSKKSYNCVLKLVARGVILCYLKLGFKIKNYL